MSEADKQRQRLWAVAASISVGALLMAAKFWAWHLTGSAAILSDALESIINVVAGTFAGVSVYMAALPPDPDHPYGHGKIEFFSAGAEGALILVAAGGIIYSSVPKLLNPSEIPSLDIGLAVVLGTSLVNMALGIVLMACGRRTNSLTLIADGRHVMTDVYTSAGVVGGLILVRLTHLTWLDPLIAIAVGVNILFTGWHLMKQAFAGLMDASDPALLDEICTLLRTNRSPEMLDVHFLRAWRSGNRVHVDFHLIMPRDTSLTASHDLVKHLEAVIATHFAGLAEVLIHVDPCVDEECPVCTVEDCNIRKEDARLLHLWRREYLTPNRRAAEKLNV